MIIVSNSAIRFEINVEYILYFPHGFPNIKKKLVWFFLHYDFLFDASLLYIITITLIPIIAIFIVPYKICSQSNMYFRKVTVRFCVRKIGFELFGWTKIGILRENRKLNMFSRTFIYFFITINNINIIFFIENFVRYFIFRLC